MGFVDEMYLVVLLVLFGSGELLLVGIDLLVFGWCVMECESIE